MTDALHREEIKLSLATESAILSLSIHIPCLALLKRSIKTMLAKYYLLGTEKAKFRSMVQLSKPPGQYQASKSIATKERQREKMAACKKEGTHVHNPPPLKVGNRAISQLVYDVRNI